MSGVMEREIEYWPPGATEPRTILVSIGMPVQDVPCVDGTDWSCTLTITGFDEPVSIRFPGVDALHAFLTAVSFAPLELRLRAPDGRLAWLDEADLGFATQAFS